MESLIILDDKSSVSSFESHDGMDEIWLLAIRMVLRSGSLSKNSGIALSEFPERFTSRSREKDPTFKREEVK